jgi:hypothetical protein
VPSRSRPRRRCDPRTLLTDLSAPLPHAADVLLFVVGGAGVVLLLATLGVLAALLVRWRRAEPLVRRQLVCLLPTGLLLAVGLVLTFLTEVTEPWLPAVVALPLGLTFAVLRYRFADLDLYVHRGSVWVVLTALAVAVYAVTVTVVSSTVVGGDSPWVSLLGAGAVAALLQPAERLAQRGVSRLLYGRRDEPYAVVTELGRHLAAVRDPLAVLPRIAGPSWTGCAFPTRRSGSPRRTAPLHGGRAGQVERPTGTVRAGRPRGAGRGAAGGAAPDGRCVPRGGDAAAARPRGPGGARGRGVPQRGGAGPGARPAGARAGGGTPAAPP